MDEETFFRLKKLESPSVTKEVPEEEFLTTSKEKLSEMEKWLFELSEKRQLGAEEKEKLLEMRKWVFGKKGGLEEYAENLSSKQKK
jgi:hypothetical protein